MQTVDNTTTCCWRDARPPGRPQMCVDDADWTNYSGKRCADYAAEGWCNGAGFNTGSEWTGGEQVRPHSSVTYICARARTHTHTRARAHCRQPSPVGSSTSRSTAAAPVARMAAKQLLLLRRPLPLRPLVLRSSSWVRRISRRPSTTRRTCETALCTSTAGTTRASAAAVAHSCRTCRAWRRAQGSRSRRTRAR